MLVFESHRGLVAYLGSTEVLDGTGIGVAGVERPVVALRGELLERCAVEFDESLLDYGLHLAVAAFHVHHHGDGYTAGNPLNGRLGEVAERRHISGYAGIDEACGIVAEAVAVVGVEVRRIGAAAFVTEEVVHGGELAVVFAFGTHIFKTLCNHGAEQLFCLDERNLHVAVGVAVESELTGHTCGKRCVSFGICCAEIGEYELALLLLGGEAGEFLGVLCENIVEFGDKSLDGGNELDETFGNEHAAEVVAVGCAFCHYIGDVVHNLLKSHVLGLDLFGDYADIGLALECALEGDVRCRAAHEFDEVPVFFEELQSRCMLPITSE